MTSAKSIAFAAGKYISGNNKRDTRAAMADRMTIEILLVIQTTSYKNKNRLKIEAVS
jgi:hypothetical protein